MAPGRRLNQPGTFRRAGLMLAIFGLLAAGLAALWPQPSMRSPVEAYLRQGPANGAEGLRQDLLALSPSGSDAGPALQRLISMGFTCNLAGEDSGEWVCLFRRSNERRSVTSVEARLRIERGAVSGVGARIWETPPR
jgi:hypothetical protein